MNAVWFDAIIFDLDGTILDSLPGIEYSVRAAFAACRLPISTVDLRELIGPPIWKILSVAGNVGDERTLALLERAFRASYDKEGWRKTTLFTNAEMVLNQLRQSGHRLFVVTNKPKQISKKILTKLAIDCFFESMLTRDSRVPAYAGKEGILRALSVKHGLDVSKALLVGDTLEDAEAAASVGMPFAFAAHGYGKIDRDASVKAVFEFDHLDELLPFVAKELVHD